MNNISVVWICALFDSRDLFHIKVFPYSESMLKTNISSPHVPEFSFLSLYSSKMYSNRGSCIYQDYLIQYADDTIYFITK